MESIIIGSSAIKHYFPDFPREPKDLDFATLVTTNKKEEGIEYLENPVLFKYSNTKYLEPDLLYTLKASHLVHSDINWSKHLWDFQWLRKRGCKINLELFYELYSYWNTVHTPNKRSELKMTANEFFDNTIKCPYSHDWLHTLLNPIPTYLKVLKDGEEVDICENKFNNLSYEEKYALVFEEVAIMEFERNFHKNYKIGYSRMLKKFIISHAKLFEALWMLENYIELEIPKFDYRKLIINKIKENELQKT